jgi:hypothetical protein
MHIDATLLPLCKGLMVYQPERVSEHGLRKHEVFRDWELVACRLPNTAEVARAVKPTHVHVQSLADAKCSEFG